VQRLIDGSPDLSPADVKKLLGRLATDSATPAHVRANALRALLNAEHARDGAAGRGKNEIEWSDYVPEE
jgi:hypothetical protein